MATASIEDVAAHEVEEDESMGPIQITKLEVIMTFKEES
jgi:hypothetical protein